MMSLMIKENRSDFVLAPEGLHIARCYALIDLGLQKNEHFKNCLPKILIGWELYNASTSDNRPLIHLQRFTASLNAKSKLRSLLESWRGKSFTSEELQGFQLKNILGAPCYLTLKHTVNSHTQKKWANVISVCRLPESVVCPEPINKVLYFDLDHYSDDAYFALPENIRKKININNSSNENKSNSSNMSGENTATTNYANVRG
jgi:hypothetical protein